MQLQNNFGPIMQDSKTSLENLVRPRQDRGRGGVKYHVNINAEIKLTFP